MESCNTFAITDQHNESFFEYEILPEVASGSASKKFGTRDDSGASADIIDQNNEEDAETEVIIEGSSGALEDMDVDASDHPEEINN